MNFEKPERNKKLEEHRRKTMTKNDFYKERQAIFASAKARALKRVAEYRTQIKKV